MNRIRRTVSLALVFALVGLGLTTAQAQRTYGTYNRQAGELIRRVETSTANFQSSLNDALNRGRYNNTNTGDVGNYTQSLRTAVAQLRDRFDRRVAVAADVQNVLQQAALVNSFLANNRMGMRVQNDWSLVRSDLDALARAYNITWDWSQTNTAYGNQGYPTNTGGYNNDRRYERGAYGRLTGTYRLDASMSDNANAVADRAVRALPYSERQRVREQVMHRLEAPDMLAIERNGNTVTIASSRAPQTTFDATGAERREQLPNGNYSRVVAQLNGDQLIVRSTGQRETDFSVTFDPVENGRRLRVTRQIWNDRLGQNPVTVQNVYDRTSDVADWNIYTGTPAYGQTGSNNYPTNTSANGSFVVPDGSVLNATLDTDLSTRTANTGDHFTMTVNSPEQFRGAVIDGHVASVSRSGRITGRSEMSLNFDDIRMPNGQTYQFAGFIDTVSAANGDTVQVDNEGTVRDRNQTTQTEERAAIGTAVGAIIGAIAGGGRGAAIGAVLGAGAGAGSVYAQGRNDLDLMRGSQVTIRASAPNR